MKSEEVVNREKCLRPFLVHGRHGNAEMHGKYLRPFVQGCHGNAEIHTCTKFHHHAFIVWCGSLRSEEVVSARGLKKMNKPLYHSPIHL